MLLVALQSVGGESAPGLGLWSRCRVRHRFLTANTACNSPHISAVAYAMYVLLCDHASRLFVSTATCSSASSYVIMCLVQGSVGLNREWQLAQPRMLLTISWLHNRRRCSCLDILHCIHCLQGTWCVMGGNTLSGNQGLRSMYLEKTKPVRHPSRVKLHIHCSLLDGYNNLVACRTRTWQVG